MKKLLITLLAALTVSGAALAQETPFPDIPAGHWAADAVGRIADLGIVIGFPDGTFRGNESFTRYQAALVVSRLLDIVNSNIAAAQAMTDDDIASLRNAVQELAADLAAQGATVAAISDDVAANTARIEAIEQALAAGGLDPEVVEDLQNQLASLRVAVDTAQARADQALAAAQGLEAQVAQNAADIAVVEELVTGLSQDVRDLLQGAGEIEGVPPGLSARIARNESDIANIREFVILLRRDQVDLRNRVAGIEDVNERQDADIAALDARVTELERNAFTISGSLALSYNVERLSGDLEAVDVDRIWGLNNERDMGASAFSTGADDLNDDGDDTDVGEVAQDRDDVGQPVDADDLTLGATGTEGEFDSDLTLSFAFARGGAGGSDVITDFEAVIELEVQQAFNLDGDSDLPTDSDGDPDTSDPLVADSDYFDGYVFTVSEIETTFTIGGAPVSIEFGEDPDITFTPYVFDSEGDGFAATVGAPDFLAFLDPTLYFAYGEHDDVKDYDADTDGSNDSSVDIFPDTYYRAARLTLSPFEGVTLGGSYAELATNAAENADVLDDNETVTVFGVDGTIGLSIFDVAFEYAQSSGIADSDTGFVDEDGDPIDETRGSNTSLLFVEVGVDGESIPLLESLTANYRDIPGDWGGLEFDDDDYPYALDQAGFGVEATLDVFILDVTGYFDSYAATPTGGDAIDTTTAFGVDATAELFSAFSLTGFYHSVSVNGATVDSQSDPFDADEVPVLGLVDPADPTDAVGIDRDNDFATEFGVELAHDGAADDALIPNLDLSASYTQSEADFSLSTISAEAEYELNVSVLTLSPYVGYEVATDADDDETAQDYTTLMVGTGLETAALDVFTQPSLVGAVNYRTTDHTGFGLGSFGAFEDADGVDADGDTRADPFTATELQYSVGLQLNEFLFDNSVLTARYGSWTGTNINDEETTQGDADFATDISGDDEDNGLTQSTNGYEVTWSYFDLEFAYGAYLKTITDGTTTTEATGAQEFSISYTINF